MADSEVIQLALESPLSALRSLLFSVRSVNCFSCVSECVVRIPLFRSACRAFRSLSDQNTRS